MRSRHTVLKTVSNSFNTRNKIKFNYNVPIEVIFGNSVINQYHLNIRNKSFEMHDSNNEVVLQN